METQLSLLSYVVLFDAELFFDVVSQLYGVELRWSPSKASADPGR